MVKLNQQAKSLFLATLLISSSGMIIADSKITQLCNWSSRIPSTACNMLLSKPVIVPTLIGTFLLCGRRSVVNFESRFSLERVKAHLEAFNNAIASGNTDEAIQALKDLAHDGWFLYYDEFVGQIYESKTVKVKNDKLYCSEEKPATGILGSTQAYLKVLGKTAEATALAVGGCGTLMLLHEYLKSGKLPRQLEA